MILYIWNEIQGMETYHNHTFKRKEVWRQTVNLLDVMEDPVDSRHSQELELVSPSDDETCRLHQIYSLLSSYRTGIPVGPASQERHSPSASDKDPQGQSQIDKMKMSLAIPQPFHFGVRYCKTEHDPAGGFLEMKQSSIVPGGRQLKSVESSRTPTINHL